MYHILFHAQFEIYVLKYYIIVRFSHSRTVGSLRVIRHIVQQLRTYISQFYPNCGSTVCRQQPVNVSPTAVVADYRASECQLNVSSCRLKSQPISAQCQQLQTIELANINSTLAVADHKASQYQLNASKCRPYCQHFLTLVVQMSGNPGNMVCICRH